MSLFSNPQLYFLKNPLKLTPRNLSCKKKSVMNVTFDLSMYSRPKYYTIVNNTDY